jgi:hypothetical protein
MREVMWDGIMEADKGSNEGGTACVRDRRL